MSCRALYEPCDCVRCVDAAYERSLDHYEPNPEDICASSHHEYYGNDEYGGRCYCGERRYSGLDIAIHKAVKSIHSEDI